MKKIFPIILFLSVFSCGKIDCDGLSDLYRYEECLLIFEELPNKDSRLNAKGKHLITGEECVCSDKGRWWAQFRDYLEKGDTIIKRKGELTFIIQKKDTVLSYQWNCEGKDYY